jgi:hypothetical protein
MSDYYPDVWQPIEITVDSEKYIRIMAGWYGGYLNGDSWKLSSEVENIEKTDHGYIFSNASGSKYYCNKETVRFSGLTGSVFQNLCDQAEETNSIKLRVMSVEELEKQ